MTIKLSEVGILPHFLQFRKALVRRTRPVYVV